MTWHAHQSAPHRLTKLQSTARHNGSFSSPKTLPRMAAGAPIADGAKMEVAWLNREISLPISRELTGVINVIARC